MIKIDKKIVGYAVNQPAAAQESAKPEFKREGGGGNRAEVIRMHEKLERPEDPGWLDLQSEDAGVRSCDVHHDQ